MRSRFIILSALLALALSTVPGALAADEEGSRLCFKIELIWGTNGPKPNDPNLTEVDGKLKAKLKRVLRWTNYYEVNRAANPSPVCLAPGETKKCTLSEKCRILLTNQGKSMLEVKLFGEGKLERTVRQHISKEILVLAGDDKNDTAWFVVLTPR